jgi:hypothetical protein
VISLVALFIALGSGAYAASKIGTKQLKSKAVTTKKLDNKAVTTKKLAGKAVSAKKLEGKAVKTNKLARGAVTGSKIDDQSTPFSRVVHTAMGDTEQALGGIAIYPLDDDTYTQKAGQTNQYAGAADVHFEAGCTQPRVAIAYLLADPTNPATPELSDIVGYGSFTDTGAGAADGRLELGAYPGGASLRYAPDSDRPHKLYLLLQGSCTAGAGVSVSSATIDVIGTS